MKFKLAKYVAMLALAISAMAIAACGGGGNSGGSTSYFKTVTVTPVGTIADSTSTVLAAANTTDTAVTVSLVSAPYAGLTGTASPITIKSSTISYTKAANSPATAPATLTDQPGPAGPIPAGSTVAFAFTTASGIFKDNLVTTKGFVPGGQKWQYFVTYSFNATEDFTNTNVTFTVPGGTITFQ